MSSASSAPRLSQAQLRDLFYSNMRAMNPSQDLARAIDRAEAREAPSESPNVQAESSK